MDLILGLYMPSQGIIRVDGQDLRELSLFEWREHIGVVDQEVFLLNTSILENIRFGRKDASLNSGDCQIKSRFGLLDGRIATKLRKIGEELSGDD